MYKIYINETPLYLCSMEEAADLAAGDKSGLAVPYSGKTKFFTNIFDQLDKTKRFGWMAAFSKDPDKMWEDFRSLCLPIEAAGGAVSNDSGQFLLIFRRGYWDLPKGKIDAGEATTEAALREVEEETGLTHLTLGPQLIDTYHTYTETGKRILKTTHWFFMQTTQLDLIPQKEEDIEEAIWVDVDDFLKKPFKIYGNIIDVLHRAKSLKKHG